MKPGLDTKTVVLPKGDLNLVTLPDGTTAHWHEVFMVLSPAGMAEVNRRLMEKRS